MTKDTGADRAVADMGGAAALPRANGELVFEAPWEGRIFALTVALHEQGLYQWDEFRRRLIDEIAAAAAGDTASTYYERWLASFDGLLVGKGVLAAEELDARTAEYASDTGSAPTVPL